MVGINVILECVWCSYARVYAGLQQDTVESRLLPYARACAGPPQVAVERRCYQYGGVCEDFIKIAVECRCDQYGRVCADILQVEMECVSGERRCCHYDKVCTDLHVAMECMRYQYYRRFWVALQEEQCLWFRVRVLCGLAEGVR